MGRMWVRRGRLRCAFVAILSALVVSSGGDLVEDDSFHLPANLAPEVKELALVDLVDVSPGGKDTQVTLKGKPTTKSPDKPAKKSESTAGTRSPPQKSTPGSAKRGAATDKNAKEDYGTKVAESPAKAPRSSGSSLTKKGKNEVSWNRKTGFGTTFKRDDGAMPDQHQAPTHLGEANQAHEGTPTASKIVAIRTAQAAHENHVQQSAYAQRTKTANTLTKDALSADALRDSYKQKMKEHGIELMAKMAAAKKNAKKKVAEIKARLQKQTMIQAGKYVAEKTQAAAIKFSTRDIVAKQIKHAGKKLVKGTDKVAIAKRKIAAKKAKDQSSNMVAAAMLAAKNKLEAAPQKRNPKEPA